jgi:tetratricopeptide (TPR) repeat protein
MNSYLVFLLVWLILFPHQQSGIRKSLSLNEAANAEARLHFDKGLLLLHNFEYADARDEFISAQQKDPDFAMAYWGEAMTYDHPIWRDLDVEKAREALNKLGTSADERMPKGKTELEKDFINGLNKLFGEGSKPDREKAYAEHMKTLYQKYSENHDVAAFYALSLLAIKKGWNEWEEYNVEAAKITNKILKENPNHPGALHYLVHANDHPLHASKSLDAADKYAKVASYAGHALHMPSHIYLALGRWDDVVRSNEVSWQAGVDRKEKKKLDNNELNYHAHLWLLYGYLQQGRFQLAKQLVENQSNYTKELPSVRARYHLLEMSGHYLFHTNDWNSSLAELDIKNDDMDAGAQFGVRFLQGYKLFHEKKKNELGHLITDFEQQLNKAKQWQQASADETICGITRYANSAPTEGQIRLGNRYLNQLTGLHAWLNGDLKTAETKFIEALPKEGSVVVGPPLFMLSPYETYGNFLLSTNRAENAMQQFDKALAASPNRFVSLKGKLAAAKALKDGNLESQIRKQLKENFKNADQAVLKGL